MTKTQNTRNLQGLENQYPQSTTSKTDTNLREPLDTEPILRLPMVSDLVFRAVLGRDTPECKKALAAVLNLILDRESDPIVDLEYKNPFHLSQYMVEKHTIMDIKVSTSSGEIIDVEMQVEKTQFYANRSILYTGQISAEGLESGENYDRIKKAIQISFISGKMEAGSDKYHGVYRYLEVTDKTELSDVTELHYLKLNKLPNKPLEEMTPLERLGHYMANAGKKDRQEEIDRLVEMGEEAIVLTDEILRKASQDELLREQERAREWWEMDQRVKKRENIEEGRQQGLRQGRQEGQREGLRQGLQRGRQEGRKEEREEGIGILIKTCKELGLSKDDTNSRICEKYKLEQTQADEYMCRFWE